MRKLHDIFWGTLAIASILVLVLSSCEGDTTNYITSPCDSTITPPPPADSTDCEKEYEECKSEAKTRKDRIECFRRYKACKMIHCMTIGLVPEYNGPERPYVPFDIADLALAAIQVEALLDQGLILHSVGFTAEGDSHGYVTAAGEVGWEFPLTSGVTIIMHDYSSGIPAPVFIEV